MANISPRMWTYTPANSPVSLPHESVFFCPEEVIPLQFPELHPEMTLSGADLQAYCGQFTSSTESVDSLLALHDAPGMDVRRPFLLLGELANPYRLLDLKVGPLPIFTVRISGLCRTYADALDGREVIPGVHHITLARLKGWWENTHLAMATVPQMKAMVEWLDQGRRGTWRPVKPAEGALHFEPLQLSPPSQELIVWDGESESITGEAPGTNGSEILLSNVMVPVHSNFGCYDNRGRLVRCAHTGQREFHESLFRRGSSMKWSDVLDVV